MDAIAISRRLLDLCLTPDPSKEAELLQDAIQSPELYIVAARKTTPEAWADRSHAAYVSSKQLYLFMDGEDAKDFARLNGLMAGETLMARQLSITEVRSLVEQYTSRGCIVSIRLFAKMPLFMECETAVFLQTEPKVEPEALPATEAVSELKPDPEVIRKAKEILDTGDPAIRATLDPSGCFKNFHSMLDKLLRDCKISVDAMDSSMGFPSGMTANLCTNLQDSGIPLRVMKQILEAFDLSPYIYQFRGQCGEIASELAVSRIDIHTIKPASVHTTERFTLNGIRRGRDANQAYIYQLALSSPSRKVTELVSTPFGYIVGKKYSISGLDALPEPSPNSIPTPPSDAEMASVTEELAQRHHIRSYGYHDAQAEAEEHAQQRKNDIIRYMKQNLGYSAKDSEAKLASIYWEEDLLEEFWQYIKNNKAPKIKVRGYTARMLMKEMHFSPYEAYCQMIALRRKPKETEQMLKYRQTDPQYQK